MLKKKRFEYGGTVGVSFSNFYCLGICYRGNGGCGVRLL